MPQPPSAQVVLLTATDCELCEHAKGVLQRISGEYPLQVRTIPLDSPEGQRLATRNGVLFAPGLLLNGEIFSYGRVSERKLRRELSRWEASFNPQEVMQ
jgi:hypothetical protein